ncbi:hypothetical protein HK096_007555, partial [Nowakowskiella sp. JEL0078]
MISSSETNLLDTRANPSNFASSSAIVDTTKKEIVPLISKLSRKLSSLHSEFNQVESSNKLIKIDAKLTPGPKIALDEDWDKPETPQYKPEPLLIPAKKRFVLFPIRFQQ